MVVFAGARTTAFTGLREPVIKEEHHMHLSHSKNRRGQRAITAGVVIAATALLATACTSTAPPASTTSATKALKVGVIMLQGDTYYQGIQSGLEAAVKADGGTVTTGLSNNDPATEAQVAQNMIQAKMDMILMQPAADDASLPAMKAITAAGIKLVCYGNCLGNSIDPAIVSGSIQSDNTALGTGTGAAAAAYIKSKLNGTAKIAILNCDIASACKLRKAGFKQALTDAGVNATYVTDQEAYLTDKATTVTTGILTANSDLDMIWASNDGGSSGATLAVNNAGKKIPVFGTDISAQLAQFLEAPDNVLQVTTGQDPIKTAQGAYQMGKNAVAGIPNNPANVQLPGIVYDRSNPATINQFLGK
ncbi:MAG: hypothetical protein B5766_01820 [Candidatus Lumbricidophila eiseniae]|uniref:Periplasmic binding protein domain-containing protein n=1 Tax=Candidatus Lumbricidiphila eiseniae TaxID=1969409 RepID=A0A2A6FUB0_9MICO|nr:MAG: hypothetical protein B5766_01820 [Candidatus Lumbricidophila eiseniae]